MGPAGMLMVVGEPADHDLDLQRRRIISALAHNDGNLAMLSLPRRFAGTLLAQFKRAGYRHRAHWTPSPELVAVTIWRPHTDVQTGETVGCEVEEEEVVVDGAIE